MLGINTSHPLGPSVDYPSVFFILYFFNMSVNDSTDSSDVQAPNLGVWLSTANASFHDPLPGFLKWFQDLAPCFYLAFL